MDKLTIKKECDKLEKKILANPAFVNFLEKLTNFSYSVYKNNTSYSAQWEEICFIYANNKAIVFADTETKIKTIADEDRLFILTAIEGRLTEAGQVVSNIFEYFKTNKIKEEKRGTNRPKKIGSYKLYNAKKYTLVLDKDDIDNLTKNKMLLSPYAREAIKEKMIRDGIYKEKM